MARPFKIVTIEPQPVGKQIARLKTYYEWLGGRWRTHRGRCSCGIVVCVCASGEDPTKHTLCRRCSHPQCQHLENSSGPHGCGIKSCTCHQFRTR